MDVMTAGMHDSIFPGTACQIRILLLNGKSIHVRADGDDRSAGLAADNSYQSGIGKPGFIGDAQFGQFSCNIVPGSFLVFREIGILVDVMSGLNGQHVDPKFLYFTENG